MCQLLAAGTAAFLNYKKLRLRGFLCILHNNKIHRLDVFKQVLFKTVLFLLKCLHIIKPVVFKHACCRSFWTQALIIYNLIAAL